MKQKDTFSIPDRSESGTVWETFSFEQLASKMPLEDKPYRVKTLNYLRSLYKEIISELGVKRGNPIFAKTIIRDFIFNKPQWSPEKFNISGKTQEKFYKKKFNEIIPCLIFFQALAKEIGEQKADRLIANTMVPVVLDMMKSKYHPVRDIETVEVWLRQARNYLGREIEKDKGFSGTIYLAQDKSELRFHVTRCAPMQILRAYGLKYTAAALCMCDHITYHTVFPNLIFKRTHTLAIGDSFCDHEFRIKKSAETNTDEDNYSDCHKAEGMREFVTEWEEKAKKLFAEAISNTYRGINLYEQHFR